MWEVACANPAAHVHTSYDSSVSFDRPPRPFQEHSGTRASMPAASARRATAVTEGQVSWSFPSAVVGRGPPPMLRKKTPSFSLLALNSGLSAARGSSA